MHPMNILRMSPVALPKWIAIKIGSILFGVISIAIACSAQAQLFGGSMDSMIDKRFKEADKNKDGKLTLDEAKEALAEAEAALVAAETAVATGAETDEARAEEAKADDAPTPPANDADTSAMQGGAVMEPPQPAASVPPPPVQMEVEI